MARRTALFLLVAFGLLALWPGVPVAPPAAAHGGGMPWIWLEQEQVMPGETFQVLVVDYAPYSEISLEVRSGAVRAAVGTIASEGDGHGEGDLFLPGDFPHGYAELVGRDIQGGEAVTLLQVGDVPDSAGPPGPRPGAPQAPTATEWWQDPSVLVLGGFVGGALLALAYLAFRPRAPEPAAHPQRAASRNRRSARKHRGTRPG